MGVNAGTGIATLLSGGLLGGGAFEALRDKSGDRAEEARQKALDEQAASRAEMDKGTQGTVQSLSDQANKSRADVVGEQLAGVDQNKSFAPNADQVAREAAAAGGPPNMALAEALARKKQKIYGQGLEQLKAKAEFEAGGRQLTAQQRAAEVLQKNAHIKYQRQMADYTMKVNAKRQENAILTSALQFGGAVAGGIIGGLAGGPQGMEKGAGLGNQLGGVAGSLGAGSGEEQKLGGW